jgi:hypothetical protein
MNFATQIAGVMPAALATGPPPAPGAPLDETPDVDVDALNAALAAAGDEAQAKADIDGVKLPPSQTVAQLAPKAA